MRVLLWNLPVWMRDVMEREMAVRSRLESVTPPADAAGLGDAVAGARPDVVVTGSRDPNAPYGGFLPLLHQWPTLRVVSIGGSGRDTIRVTLIPNQESLGDLSLDDLLTLLAGEAPPPTGAPHTAGSR